MGRTVVIVDDYAPFRSAARRLLEAGTYHVVGEADDGASAVEVVERLQPSIVLLDVLLPDTNGFEIAQQLAKTAAGSHIVLISSRDESAYREPLSRSTVCGFIYKGDLSLRALDALLERCT